MGRSRLFDEADPRQDEEVGTNIKAAPTLPPIFWGVRIEFQTVSIFFMHQFIGEANASIIVGLLILYIIPKNSK